MKTRVYLGAAAAALIVGPAMADYEVSFNLDGPGWNSGGAGSVYVANLSGNLSSMFVDVQFTNDGGWTWAGDMHIGITDPNGNSLQFGGYDYDDGSPNAGDFPSSWDSSTSGVYSHGASLAPVLGGSGDWTFTFTDGYSSGAATDNWNGIVNMEGLTLVPAPGALALLGLAGLAGRRRRR